MRTDRKVVCILGLAFVLTACGGSSGGGSGNLNSGETACDGSNCDLGGNQTPVPSAPLVCGGAAAAACPGGYRCVADPAAGCDPASGSDCSGLCVLGEELPGCGGLAGQPCPDGQVCVDDPSDACAGGPAVDCPGTCQPAADGDCATDADCPAMGAPCSVCADGSTSCPISRCDAARCSVEFKPCSEAPACGGVSGIACAAGYECIDDPTDDCLPEPDGADCKGICVPQETAPPECGGIAGMTCPPDFECIDDPGDDCDPANGSADCAGLCKPVSGGECKSDEDCPVLRVPCPVCPDGTDACPRASCSNGRCSLTVPACPAPERCSTDADCLPGQLCVIAPNGGCDPATGADDCGGMCVPDGAPRPCGGIAGDTCPEGFSCVDAPNDDCDPNQGGADCPGVCEPAPPPACHADEECAGSQTCRACPDGSFSCAQAECRDGKCVATSADCTEPAPCSADADCAAIQAPCGPCPDGTFSCPHAECRAGMCIVAFNGCRDIGFCGGIAGFPCPPGLTCIDDPGDDCDPNQGGADCGGICVREQKPLPCARFSGESCPEGYECVDVPDECDPENGGADCPGFCRPSPSGGCTDDAGCPVIGAPCVLCADGTAACPSSSCVNGECRAEFPSCDAER
jgi:hypothetical protein